MSVREVTNRSGTFQWLRKSDGQKPLSKHKSNKHASEINEADIHSTIVLPIIYLSERSNGTVETK